MLLASIVLAVALSPQAFAANLGGSAFGELTGGAQSQPTPTTQTVAPARTATTASTNSKTVVLLALVAAIALLSVIAFVIVRDARKVAPAIDTDLLEARSSHEAAVQLRRRRAKAKAARQQRKRNR